ncbi:MAG: priA [Clostridia bacterium]|jgi:primosomal protein N' (replication factor Y)|nr:priA [Clostridia bacterium]
MQQYAQIIINFATTAEIDRIFTYRIDDALREKVQVGHRVKVPFGAYNKLQIGYVIAIMNRVEQTQYEIKSIEAVVDEEPLLIAAQLDIARFLVSYYGTSFAASINVMTPPGLTDRPFEKHLDVVEYIVLAEDPDKVRAYLLEHAHKKTFAKQKHLIEYLLSRKQIALKEVETSKEMSMSSVKTLLQNGFITKFKQEKRTEKDDIARDAFKSLNPEQLSANNKIVNALHANKYKTILLQGITGSGKTEVFLYAIKEVIESGGSAIVLVPEIALTKQTLERFQERFGNHVALSHSRMTPKERQNLYIKAQKGEISIIIGPRSAVFMPFKNLKLIVIDEEHEPSYKSESMPKYHAVDVAQMRMLSEKGVVLLASATPSIETYYKSQTGEYDKVVLNHRTGAAVLPEVTTVDMRQELSQGNNNVVSRTLYEAIRDTLKQNKQVMILINRRGHSTFINCRSCGHVIKCSHCDVSMTYHLSSKSLECHYCGKKQEIPDKCPSCDSKYIRFFGSGTEKVEEYLDQHFHEYGIGRMDLDTTTGKNGHSKILTAFGNKEINLLIGTQMIAKGHDFKDVALVGIISADMSLYMQDFRSNERTFQLLTQAMGRAGRADTKGQVIIQTYNPDHIVLERIKNNQQQLFYEQEIKNRQLMGYPPFTHLFTVLITGKDEKEVINTAHTLTQYYRHYSQKGKAVFRVIGPSTAVIGKLVDEYRWRIIILSEDRDKLLIYGRYCLEKFNAVRAADSIKIQWDINPLNMM